MIYVISDIHGEYEKYKKMLEVIGFSDSDTLYVLGDVVDRGPQPIEVLKDMMKRPNVYPLMGNHDLYALTFLKMLNVDITQDNYDTHLDVEDMNELIDWISSDGKTTIDDFIRLKADERNDVLDYISDFMLYDVVDIGDKRFILVHAGLGNFQKNKKLRDYALEDLLMSRNDPDIKYFDDDSIYIVSGHTPTPFFSGKPEIYRSCNNICIDCGACSKIGRLGCICLDTMEEFYV